MEDFQLSKDFWLSEPPCWHLATPVDASRLQETAARVLQPVRNTWGETFITSWMWWSDGCEPRVHSHAEGGTVDFVTTEAPMMDVFEWGATHLLPSGYIGRWIYEPERKDLRGRVVQGEHIHIAPRADMIRFNGDGTIKALVETADGDNYLYAQMDEGTFANPFSLDPIIVTATAKAGIGLLVILAAPLIAQALSRKRAGP